MAWYEDEEIIPSPPNHDGVVDTPEEPPKEDPVLPEPDPDQPLINIMRLLLGNVDEETLPDEVIKTFLDMEKLKLNYPADPDKLPLLKYNVLVQLVRWLMMQEVSSGNASITSRLEKIGDETIEIRGGSSYAQWKDFLDWLLAHPDYVDSELDAYSRMIIIGGVRVDEGIRVKFNENSNGPFDVQGITPISGLNNQPPRHPRRKRSF
ncbi:hypothetical protein MU003_001982 [Escherichia coli]|uniref:Ad1 adapter protein n=11 Tax=Vequintavirus TaxID=1914852 RepID=A0A6B9XA73_9CAUD|nr:hypothetical protein [Escherichia coli]YP_002003559.1 hypothetical protein rv5_gp057 [Escherichia phage V5]YP_009593900.1 hypothetical protein FDG88_gp056 [Escherichia phage Murica]AKE45622.1 hypothetical protein ECTP5_00748 [Escherichia coli O157 typing phage 5]AKE47032.1 hypothetical protein ECTP14_02256 [Escherichia coli O157 typing phage 14]EKM3217794.1 hypothetical protein [Escherichia coli O157]QHR73212.1 hypothetical protein nimi_186 [Escherichia phage nimi]QHR73392.1 hypothetical 